MRTKVKKLIIESFQQEIQESLVRLDGLSPGPERESLIEHCAALGAKIDSLKAEVAKDEREKIGLNENLQTDRVDAF